MSTYRATVTAELEISTDREWIEDGVRILVQAAIQTAVTSYADARHGRSIALLGAATVDMVEPWCAAINRRNRVDGQLYACQMAKSDSIHGPVVDWFGCEEPGQHHEYLSPGWDAPMASAPQATAS